MSQPHFDWVRNYPIRGRAAAIDSSGYVYIVGTQQSLLGIQTILKYDSLGNIIWAKDFNLIPGSNYVGMAAYKSRYFYITYSNQNHSFGLTKFDTSGTLLWTRNISGYYYEPFCLTLDTSGNIYVTGEIDYYAANCFTVKYSPAGDTLWRAIYYPSTTGGSYIGRSISVDNQKNVYITGGESYQFINSYTTIKYDSLGNRKWISKYYSPYSPFSNAVGVSLKADNKGNCYVTGGVDYAVINGNGMATPVTIKYGPNGDSIWTRLFRLQDTINFGAGEDIALDDNDNVYIPSNYTIKYDKNGNQLWYARNNYYMSKAIIFESNIYVGGGNYIYDFRILGYNNISGRLIFNQQYPVAVKPTGLMNYYNSMYAFIHTNDSAILIKYTSNSSSISGHVNTINDFKLKQNYPNPFNSSTNIGYSLRIKSLITLRIYDISGKEIATLVDGYKPAGEYKTIFNAVNLSSGIYFYSLSADNKLIDTKKLITIK
jgi:hypothetical protein